MTLAELGKQLRAAGLNPRALAMWAGTDRISALSERIDDLAAREPTPAALALSMFVAGRDLSIDRIPAAGARARSLPVDALLEHGFVVEDARADTHEDGGRCLRAQVAILPVGTSTAALIVCDRADAPPTAERVCWPDDSSYHLVGAIPRGRVRRWLDLGTGSAFGPLARPEAATEIVGIELNRIAAAMAAQGAALSGIAHVAIEPGDLGIEQAPADLVTCNAPMPGDGIEMWRHADRGSSPVGWTGGFFERLWRVVPERLAPGATAIIHADVAAIPYERLAGERRIVIYTPPDATPAFAVLWWRPDAADDLAISHRPLTADRPHVDADDR